MSDHKHYPGCHLHHFPCCLERVRDLEKQLAAYKVPVTTATHATYIPCDSSWYTHHGDEPPSATP